MNAEKVMELALQIGFTHAGTMDPATAVLRSEVRDMCAACSQYGLRWSCPPGCGDLETLRQRLTEYKEGVLVQTVGNLEDDFDAEAIMGTQELHKEQLQKLIKPLKELFPDAAILGAGCCTVCKTCTYPDAPCRFPDRLMASMEAWGMVVSDVCRDNGVKYYYGPLTIAYTSCILLK